MKNFRVLVFTLTSSCLLFSQTIQVNRQNKTIAITAEDSVTADAEIAVLEIGYHNFAPTQSEAFQQNVAVAEKITKALLDAKIPRASIQTEKLSLAPTATTPSADEKWPEEMKKERQFTAEQTWHIKVPAMQAQSVVDLGVRAGANEVDDPEWNVIDPVALQAKASGAALAKARIVADQMAKGLGAKLGELVYASNQSPRSNFGASMETVNVEAAPPPPTEKEPKLTLFPQKVKSDATVFAVFSIE